MLRLTNITFRYDDESRPALDNLTLHIREGESVAVMGANGSGKTTFVRMVAGLIEPMRGQLDILKQDQSKPTVGMLFQNPDNQIVAVTVEKEIAFSLENLGVETKEMHRRVEEAMLLFGIEKLRNRLTSELSGGEKQRVALASVMITKPDILLLDEPDSFLDQKGKLSLLRELKHLREQHPEMIQVHVTQYPQIATEYDRLIVFHQGAVVADQTPVRVFEDHEFSRKCGLMFAPQSVTMQGNILSSGLHQGNRRTNLSRLKADRICFSYSEEREVIKHLSVEVRSGDVVSVIGESGCGKSSLSLVLCSLYTPTSGQINYYDDIDAEVDLKSIAGRVVTVLQQPERQFFLPTVAEELRFGPGNLGIILDDSSLGALLDLVGLSYTQFASRDPFSLSGGEKRRLAFATLLASDPSLIIFDEPTCGLDPSGVGLFVELVNKLRELGKGVVIITHDGDIVRSLSDTVLAIGSDLSSIQFTPDQLELHPQFEQFLSPVSWSTSLIH